MKFNNFIGYTAVLAVMYNSSSKPQPLFVKIKFTCNYQQNPKYQWVTEIVVYFSFMFKKSGGSHGQYSRHHRGKAGKGISLTKLPRIHTYSSCLHPVGYNLIVWWHEWQRQCRKCCFYCIQSFPPPEFSVCFDMVNLNYVLLFPTLRELLLWAAIWEQERILTIFSVSWRT